MGRASWWTGGFFVAALLVATRGLGHHSFAATYVEDQVVTIEGELVQFLFRNPHSFLHVMAPDAQGELHRWAVEWSAGGRLSREGITRFTLKPGDHVVITGNPGRNAADHRIRARSIYRPRDGWKWTGIVE